MLFLSYMSGLYWLSSRQDVGPVGVAVPDKIAHAIAYFGLSLAARPAFGVFIKRRRAALVAAIVAASLYGAFDEWHQSFVPKRTSDVNDWIADTVGAVVAGILILLIERRMRDRRALSAKKAAL